MSVPQMLLFLLRQTLEPVIPLACRPGAVFPYAEENTEDGETNGGDLAAEVDGVAGVVLGRIGGDVGPSMYDWVRSVTWKREW